MKLNKWIISAVFPVLIQENGFSLPQNPQVIEGTASIESTNNQQVIQSSNRCIIQWSDFSIQKNESVHFSLPSTDSAVLNRVVGGNPSEIFGQLHSNGVVYLINPNGILVGKEGLIHVGSLFASTLDVSNRDFLEGKELHFSGDLRAAIENQGKIASENGHIILLAEQIKNEGDLLAPQGLILIGVGHEITYFPYANEKIQIHLHPKTKTGGEPVGILQKGILRSKEIELKADGNLYSYAIKNEGTLEASSIENRNGRIYLVADDGVSYHNGSMCANEVRVLGQHVRIEKGAVVDVSSPEGGGTILIGGDYQGNNPEVLNANTTLIQENALLIADATVKGDGGKVIVWADGITGYYGTIESNGGPEGGNGGFVEISGKCDLDFQGLVHAGAPQGKTGTLLLDPANITISSAIDSNITFTACPVGAYAVTANTANINNTTLVTNLGSTCDIVISTSAAGTQAGTISVNDPIVWTTDRSLTLNASSGITVGANITNTSNAASLTLSSGRTTSSTLTINAGATVSLTGSGVSPTGTLTLQSNIISTSDMTISGTVSAVDKDLTILCADDFTLTAVTGSIDFNSPGKTFTYTSGTAATNISNFNGPVTITDGNVAFTAGTLNFNNSFSTAGSGNVAITAGAAVTTATAGTTTHGSSGTFTLSSTLGTAITLGRPFVQTGGAVAINGGAGLAINNNYTNSSTSSTTTLKSGTISAATLSQSAGTTISSTSTGAFTLDANTTVGSDITLSGAVSITGSDLNILFNDDFTLTAITGSIAFNSPSKTFTYTSGTVTGSVSNFNGTTTITDGNVAFTTGTLNFNESFSTAGSGNIAITAGGAVTTATAGTTTHGSSGTFTLSSSLGTAITLGRPFVQTGGAVAINGGSGLAINAGYTNSATSSTTTLKSGTISVGTLSQAAGTTISSTSTGDFTLDANTTVGSDITLSGAVTITGSNLNILLSDDFTLTATTGSIAFNSPGKTFTYTSGATAGSISNFNGSVTITDGNVTFTAGTLNFNESFSTAGSGTIAITAGGAVTTATAGTTTHGSSGTFTLSSTLGTAITLGRPFVQSGGAVTIEGGAGLSINAGYTNNTASSTTTLKSGQIAAGTLTFGSASALTYGSTGNLLLQSDNGGDITINDSVTISSADATFSPSDDFTLAATGTIDYSATGKTLTFNAGPTTSHTFTGVLDVTGGNLSVTSHDDITISASTGEISYNVVGGTCELIGTGGVDPDVNINGTLNMLNGTLTISSVDDILEPAGGVFNHSSTGTASLTAASAITLSGTTTVSNGSMTMSAGTGISLATGSTLTWTSTGTLDMTTNTAASTSEVSLAGTIAYSGGAWNIDSQGDVSITGFGVPFTYNPSGALSPFTVLSHLGDITLSRSMTFTTPSSFSLTTSVGGLTISEGTITNTLTGPWTFDIAGSFLLGFHESTNSVQVGTAGGAMQIDVGTDMQVITSTLTTGVNAQLGFSSGDQHPDTTINIGTQLRMEAYEDREASIISNGAMTITIDGDMTLTANHLSGGTGGVIIQADDDLTIYAENMILIGNATGPSIHAHALGGDLLLVAQDSLTALYHVDIHNHGSGSLTIVVDQQASSPPSIGSGLLDLFRSVEIGTTGGGPVSIFAATPSQTTLPAEINDLPTSDGTTVYNTWYSTNTQPGSFPYTIFYKSAGSPSPTPSPSPSVNTTGPFQDLVFASAQVNQIFLDRTMGWGELTAWNACKNGSSETYQIYRRRPFEYPLFVTIAPCN